jgi:hypothetical protein
MKLSEVKLFEEPIQTRTAQEVWSENESSAVSYVISTIYNVRPVADKDDRFEVTYDKNGKRTIYATMDQDDLDASFVPIRPNQKPDVEGYTSYRSADVYDAFKYGGDPVKLTLDGDAVGATAKLNKGDYLLRQDDGNDFIYTVERANYFDNSYVKK